MMITSVAPKSLSIHFPTPPLSDKAKEALAEIDRNIARTALMASRIFVD